MFWVQLSNNWIKNKMANTNTGIIVTENDIIKIGGTFHQHIVTDTYEADEYLLPSGALCVINEKPITN